MTTLPPALRHRDYRLFWSGFGELLADAVDRWRLMVVVLDSGATLFREPIALLPIYARDLLGVGATGLGILVASISVGSPGARPVWVCAGLPLRWPSRVLDTRRARAVAAWVRRYQVSWADRTGVGAAVKS